MTLKIHNTLSKTKEEFKQSLKEAMSICKDSLELKRKAVEEFTEAGLYPYSKVYLDCIYKRFKEYWANHFSTIGIIGMNEASLNLIQKSITTEEGNDFAIEILDFMREIISQYQIETEHLYNLEATPAEGTSYRLALLDQKRFHDMIFANGLGKNVVDPFYTNSTHVPVNHSGDPFEILDLQDDLQTKYTGGTVIHFFIGERINDRDAVKNIIKKICNNYFC